MSDEGNEASALTSELRTHNRLKEDDIRNLEVITDEDFSDIIDSMLLNDYRRIPNVIRLPNIRSDLAEKLGLEKDSAFIMKNGISHIRPDRKGSYGQAFSDEEYRMIPEVMRNANFAVVDKYFKNFQIVFDDQNEENKVNKIVFNKDKLGNYLITIGKVDRQNAFSEERNEVVGVGFAPTIRTLRMGVSSTRLRASPTTENSVAQEDKSVNEKEVTMDTVSKAPFQKMVDALAAIDAYCTGGIVPKGGRFIFPGTPEYLKRIGSDETEIMLPVSVVKKTMETHHLTKDEIKSAVCGLYDPVLAFDSDKSKTENKADSRLILTNEFKDGKPIALSVNVNADVQFQKDGHRTILEVQDIRSIHDRTLTAKNGTDMIKKWTEDGLCRYVDDKKITDWSTIARVYFPIEVLQSADSNILRKSDIVNGNFSEERNEVVGVGFAPTIRTLRMGVSSTRLRASPTTENSIAQEDKSVNEREESNGREFSAFDDELGKFFNGKIAGNHIFNLGKPGEILQKCGFPKDHRIELSGSRLMKKAKQRNHPFDITDVKGLDRAIQNPVAVFEYGNKEKSQNVIVELQRDEKNFLVGVFFNQKQRGYEVSDIRGLFNRDNIDWIRWIEQGKMIYGDKERIQVLAAQQRSNFAEVNRKEARTSSDSYYLDSADSIMQKFGDVKDVYTENFEFYKENKERYKIFKAFRDAYQELESIETVDTPMLAKEFYEALKNDDTKTLLEYTDGEMYPEIAERAGELVRSFNLEHSRTQKLTDKTLFSEERNEYRTEKHIDKENKEMETKPNEETNSIITPKEYLKNLLSKAEIEVIEDTGVMRAILDEGKRVQKMAAKYGTNQDIDGEEAFNGFGTYVVSVNEENARQLGIKIASKRYGGNFYINGQPFNEFLREKNFSPYWTSRLEQFKDYNVEYLADDFLRADVKGNPALEKERDTLSTLFSLDLVEYKRERAFLYSVDIPDNDSTNYLLYGSPIGIESANRINERLERMNVEWRVTRNDIGKNVYFNTLSEKVFGGSQESASRFLKEIGYVGMEMNAANYIVFDDKDMKVTNRVQYMIDGDSNVYGFAYDGRIYADPEIATSNTYAHEYTHLWDAYTRRTNPELWEKGKDIFKGTSLWNEVMTDENYQNLSDDDEILSECHSRIVGRMAEKVLSRIAEKNGGLLRDQVIDWDNEVAEYVAGELGAEFPQPELGGESYISDSVRLEIAREFLSRPMKDLMEGRKITQNVPFQNIIQEMAEEHAFPDVREYFKFNRTDSENFEKALDNFDGRNPLQLIKVGEIPPVMKALGISDNPIEMPQSVVSKALREEATYPNDKKGHALTMEHVKRIPESLADPIMVFKSRTRDDSYVFFTEQKDESDRSIIIPVAVDKRYGRLVINEITSIYGKDNEAHFVKTNIEQGNLVYADKKRSLEWERECQIQFLAQVLPSEGSYSSILTKENLVNFVSAVGKEKIQKMAKSVENAIAEPTAEAWAKDIETKLNLGMEQDISRILAESEAVGVKENAGEIAGEICGAILSVYKEIAEHGDTGYFEGGERQMSNKFAGNCTQKVLEAHGIFLPNYPDESDEREKLFSTIQQVSDEISDFIKTNTYENFLHRQGVGTQQDIGLSDGEMVTAERPNREAETDYADPIETAEAWHNGTNGKPEENVAATKKTVKASEIFKDFEESMIFAGISHKEFDRAMLGYLHQRSGREEAGNGTFDTQAMFELLVVQKIHDARTRAFVFGKIGQYEGMTVEFDADNIDLGYLKLSDREGAEEVRKELEELKAAHPTLVRNLSGQDKSEETTEFENPFLNADPKRVQELYEQAKAVERMQQEAALNVEFDRDGNPYYPENEAMKMGGTKISSEQNTEIQRPTQNENAKFFESIKRYLEDGATPVYNEFKISETPQLLQYAGVPNHEIVITTKILNKAKNAAHNLDNEEILSALKGLVNPIIIFDSDKEKSEAKGNSVLIFTEGTDKNNSPLAIGFEMETQKQGIKENYVVNQINSIYSRTTLINSRGENMLEKWTVKGLLKYVDDKKISGWLKDRQVQFPLSLANPDEINITDLKGDVKHFSVKTRTGFENLTNMDISKEDMEYIHSSEFIEKFGDWEKANRLEKLIKAESIIGAENIFVGGNDITDLVKELRTSYSKDNLKQLQDIEKDIGAEVLDELRKKQGMNSYEIPSVTNLDNGKEYKIHMQGIKEVGRHNLFQKGHIEAVRTIPTLIENSVFLGKEKNEDNRNPSLREFHYFASGMRIGDEDYTAKIVFTLNDKGEFFYDQSLSTIEKGKFVDIIREKNKPEVFNPKKSQDNSELSDEYPSTYYDKRLYQICQVPQMPYLEKNGDGQWQPAKEAIEAVRRGELMIKKEGLSYEMVEKSPSDKTESVQKTAENSKTDNLEERAGDGVQGMDGKLPSEFDRLMQDKFQGENETAFRALDDYLERGMRPKNDEFIFSSMPEVLHAAGISSNEIVIKTSVINKAMKEHGLSVGEVRDAIQNISNPVLIFNTDNASENKKESILALTDVFAQNGKPVAFSMNLDSEYERKNKIIEVNEIRTIHDRTLVAKNGTDLIQKWTADGLCRYIDDKKISEWSKAAGVQFPLAVLQSDTHTIFTKSDFVKKISSDEAENIQKTAENSKTDNLQGMASDKVQQNEGKHIQTMTERQADNPNDKKQDTAQTIGTEEREKDALPAFALMTKDGLKMFEGYRVQGFDNVTRKYTVENERGDSIKMDEATIESIRNPRNTMAAEKEESVEAVQTQSAIVAGRTMVPEFAMITQNGLREFKGMVVQKYSPSEKMWTLSNAEGERVSVSENTFKELTSENQRSRAKEFDKNTPAYKKMLETQYNDYFKQRENTASNFIHNLSVYSRKEANSPIDAIRLSSVIIKQMSPGEKQKTRELLKTLCKDGETINGLIANTYLEAVKDKPLNEEYILSGRYKDTIARPMYDTISAKGEKVDNKFNLRIGDTVSNVSFKTKKTFGAGSERMVADWTVISASKEGNIITLKSGNSFRDVPRDTFLKQYSKQEKNEQKQEVKERKRNPLNMNIER